MASLAHPMLLKHKNSKLPSMRGSTRTPTTVLLLQMCHNFHEITQLHAQLVVSGLIDRPRNSGRLIESYISMSSLHYASSLFDTLSNPDVFAYNMMIRGLSLGKCPRESIVLYNDLMLNGLKPDNHTFTFVLKACSYINALFLGKQVHCQIIKYGISADTYIHSSLIHMYANSGSTDSAERVLTEFSEENVLVRNSMISGYFSQGRVENAGAMFDGMRVKDTATWSAMITGYTKNGMYGEALVLFKEMMASRVESNESTLVSALNACARLGALDQGRWIHTYINKIKCKTSVTLGTCLVDMYAKCGCIGWSYEVFRNMPRKDVVTWGVIVSAFALHGQAMKCFELFDEMVADRTSPNEVIFVAILSACSHAGHIELGQYYFDKMVHGFGIRPTIEHYGCMVDLLARAGRLEEAEKLVSTMSEKPNSVIWGSVLGACRNYRDVKRGKRAFRELIELEPFSGDRYKLGGHVFAGVGEEKDADEIRKVMKERKLETTRGSSLIEVDGVIHEFVVGDVDHRSAQEMYEMLEGTYIY